MRSTDVQHVIDTVRKFWPRLVRYPEQVAAFVDGLARLSIDTEQADSAIAELFRTHKGHPSAAHVFERLRQCEPGATYTDAPDAGRHGTAPMPPAVEEWRQQLSGMVDGIEVATVDVVAREWLLFRWRKAARLDEHGRNSTLLMLLRIARVTWTTDHPFPRDPRSTFTKVDRSALVRRMAALFGIAENHPAMTRAMQRPVTIPGAEALRPSFTGTSRQEQWERKRTIREIAKGAAT